MLRISNIECLSAFTLKKRPRRGARRAPAPRLPRPRRPRGSRRSPILSLTSNFLQPYFYVIVFCLTSSNPIVSYRFLLSVFCYLQRVSFPTSSRFTSAKSLLWCVFNPAASFLVHVFSSIRREIWIFHIL